MTSSSAFASDPGAATGQGIRILARGHMYWHGRAMPTHLCCWQPKQSKPPRWQPSLGRMPEHQAPSTACPFRVLWPTRIDLCVHPLRNGEHDHSDAQVPESTLAMASARRQAPTGNMTHERLPFAHGQEGQHQILTSPTNIAHKSWCGIGWRRPISATRHGQIPELRNGCPKHTPWFTKTLTVFTKTPLVRVTCYRKALS